MLMMTYRYADELSRARSHARSLLRRRYMALLVAAAAAALHYADIITLRYAPDADITPLLLRHASICHIRCC